MQPAEALAELALSTLFPYLLLFYLIGLVVYFCYKWFFKATKEPEKLTIHSPHYTLRHPSSNRRRARQIYSEDSHHIINNEVHSEFNDCSNSGSSDFGGGGDCGGGGD